MKISRRQLALYTFLILLVALFVTFIATNGLTWSASQTDLAMPSLRSPSAVIWMSISSLGGLFLILVGSIYRHSRREIGLVKENFVERLRAQEDVNRFFKLSVDMLCIVSPEGYFQRLNPAFSATLGYSEEELLSKPYLSFVYPEDQESTIAEAMRISTDAPPKPFNNRFVCADGTQKWLSWSTMLVPTSGQIYAIAREVTEQHKIQEQTETSLKEKETLLTEIHHRVKNNMQMISSLLSLQSEFVEDQKNVHIFQECQDRIRTMAMVHESLYQSKDASTVDFSDYIPSLLDKIIGGHTSSSSCISSSAQVEQACLDVDTAIPCALIINELVSNSVTHGLSDQAVGRIYVEFKLQDDGNFNLVISDDGVGMPEGVDFQDPNSLGLQLVNMMVDQLDGTIELDNSNGTKFIMQFPNPGANKAVSLGDKEENRG